MSTRVGFVGLGVMGQPMAGHIAAAGHEIAVFDIDSKRVSELTRKHPSASAAASPREVAEFAEIVFTMLPSGKYVQSVALDEQGLLAGFSGGELVVDTSSCEPQLTLETAKALASKGVAMVDSPTSGAEMGAKSASLVFMVGGAEADVARCVPLLNLIGNQVFHLGPLGSGHMMKSINNLVTAMTFLATAEGLALGTKLGLDPNVMTDVMNVCTGMSWITQTHIKQRITNRSFDDAFKLELMVKDMRIALELAQEQGIDLPFSHNAQAYWQAAEAMAEPHASVSELVRWVEKTAGVEISA